MSCPSFLDLRLLIFTWSLSPFVLDTHLRMCPRSHVFFLRNNLSYWCSLVSHLSFVTQAFFHVLCHQSFLQWLLKLLMFSCYILMFSCHVSFVCCHWSFLPYWPFKWLYPCCHLSFLSWLIYELLMLSYCLLTSLPCSCIICHSRLIHSTLLMFLVVTSSSCQVIDGP